MTLKTEKNSWLGVDTGGTFTDFVYFDGDEIHIHKVLSTPAAPEQAILQGIAEMGITLEGLKLVHGSTVATNAVLESRGVKTLYITNRGFKHVMHIGRQARPELYNLQPEAQPFFIDEEDCLEVDCRLSAQGEVLQAPHQADLKELRQQIMDRKPRAVAINLLFSFLDDSHEKQIAAIVPDDIFISRSSDVLPEYREFERGMATCLNAYVGPLMESYLQRLQEKTAGASLSIMQSSAGTIGARQAARQAVSLLLSGPAGGLKAAQFVAALSGRQQLLTFDMGGTSTDVALIDGDIKLTSEGRIGHYPVPVPMVDMHTIGAGGGSIASLDAGGMLHVGPASAGADPGPACYGQGGRKPTVTDANLVLGRLPATAALGGSLPLDLAAARAALQTIAEPLNLTVEQAAQGVIRIANEHMVAALRVISVQRGVDPAGFDLVSFGGAGGLHVCALADALQMQRAIVPLHGGVLSALGMLVARPSRNLSRTLNGLIADCHEKTLLQAFEQLTARALQDMAGEISGEPVCVWSLDCRYKGQSFTLNLPWTNLASVSDDFHQLHESRYGHRLDMPVELVNIRVQVTAEAAGFTMQGLPPVEDMQQGRQGQAQVYAYESPVDIYQRERLGAGQRLAGPVLIVEKNSTSFIESGWQCEVAECGNLMLSRTA